MILKFSSSVVITGKPKLLFWFNMELGFEDNIDY